jgi:hypothetical protein
MSQGEDRPAALGGASGGGAAVRFGGLADDREAAARARERG